ncbi:MAG: hypothetical protein AB1758_00475 [Candidatus Eremiobacterota bacterium]
MRVFRRGTALGAVLSIVSIALLAAFTVAATSSINLQVAQKVENSQMASHLAESALQEAIARLMGLSNWQGDVSLAGPVPGSTGRLTFNRGLGLPFSTNNQDGTRPNGWNRSRLLPAGGTVPAERAHLVAVGRCQNEVRTVEALVHVPNFTVSVASTGRVLLSNSLVASLKNPQDFALIDSNPGLLGPGDLATNDSSAGAITLDRGSYVTGNVQTCGTVSLLNGSRVGGEVRSPFTPADLPAFNLDEYDPAAGDVLNYQELPSDPVGDQSLVGLVRCSGNTRIQGDLRLDNALLFVDGDLEVEGGLVGTGAVLVKRDTVVRGGVNLTSDDSIALITEGDVTLDGDRPDRYEFHGLIYTRGNFSARNFTVLGAFIANGSGPGKGNITMRDSKAYFTNAGTDIAIFFPRQLVLQIASSNIPDRTDTQISDFNTKVHGKFPGTRDNPGNPIPWRNPKDGAEHENGREDWGLPDGDDDPWHWYDTVLLEIREENDRFVFEIRYQTAGSPQVVERFNDVASVTNRLVDLCATMCPAYNDGVSPDPDGDGEIANPRETSEYRRNVFYPQLWAQFLDQPADQSVKANFWFDPNRFLKDQDKLRIAGWMEY